MPDLIEAKEALDRLRDLLADTTDWYDWHEDSMELVFDAARRWVRMVETGEQVEWCETHWCTARPEGPGGNPGLRWCYLAEQVRERNIEPLTECRIVSRLIAAVGVEKET